MNWNNNNWNNGGNSFPDNVTDSIDRWYRRGGESKKNPDGGDENQLLADQVTTKITKRVILFGGIDYYNTGEFGLNKDIADDIAKANGPYNHGLGDGDVVVFNSPALVNDFDTDIHKPVLAAIKKNNFDTANGILVFYGYSWGANIIMSLLEKLKGDGITINFLLTIDAAKGPFSFSVVTTVPDNVNHNLNIYQTTPSNIGSHGYVNTGANVKNVNLTGVKTPQGANVEHPNIDDYTKLFSDMAIIYALSNKYDFMSLSEQQLKDKMAIYASKQ